MTFMSFPEDTEEQKSQSVGRIMPHTEVSPPSVPNQEAQSLLPVETPSLPPAGSSPGLARPFLCGLRPERKS